MPVWLSGVALYRLQGRLAFGPVLARAGWVLSIVLIGLWGWFDPETYLRGVANGLWPFPGIRMGSADRVLADYAVMLLVLLNFACARQARFDALLLLARPIRFLAGHTFTLYLSHGIVIGLWQTLLPIERGAAHEIVAIGTAIAVVALTLNPLTEALQRTLRRAIDAALSLGARGLGLRA
ncbi:hypothetical protein GCM10025794_31170 [Massilia kyonggiensis]